MGVLIMKNEYPPILDRNKRPTCKADFLHLPIEPIRIPTIAYPKDYNHSYYDIGRFLIHLHKRMGYTPKGTPETYLRQVKKLVTQYGYEKVIQAMLDSIGLSGINQFSFVFVEKVLSGEVKKEEKDEIPDEWEF